MDRHNKIKVRKCITIIIRDWIIPLVPVFTVIIVMFYWGFYCWSRPSLMFNECSDAMLQQLTSYYETMITILVMIITILLATSFVSIYYVTKRQVKSTIEEVVIEAVDTEFNRKSFEKQIGEKVKDFCQSSDGLDIIGNYAEIDKTINELKEYNSLHENRINAILQELYELKEEIHDSKTTNSKRKTNRNSNNGIQKTNNKQQG